MRKYELMMILNPQLDKSAMEALQKEIKADLKELSVKVASEDNWGDRDLAYKISGSSTGYYCLWQLEAEDPSRVNDASGTFNIKPGLWRYMFSSIEE